MRKAIRFESPFGIMTVIEEDGFVVEAMFGNTEPSNISFQQTSLLDEAKKQLLEYFAGKRKVFNLPIKFKSTPFTEKVWQALRTIPFGQTASYSNIALQVNSPKAQRAVGRACKYNPIALIVPCHRVIGKNNDLVGFFGGLELKEALLKHEKSH